MSGISIAAAFENIYQKKPELAVRAPGRINLIGEHTDYNEGYVLPAAIDKAIYFYLAKRSDKTIKLHAADLNDNLEINIENLSASSKPWANFLIGVIKELKDNGAEINEGFDLAFGGDVPLGAGLSSSAAIESGMGYALNQLFDLGKSLLDLALTAQKAEHNFAGVNCGIMDMYASLFGKENHLIRLDCRSLTHEYLPFNLTDLSIILFNTGVQHNLADSEYNKRRQECENGVAILRKYNPEMVSLRNVSLSKLAKHKKEFSDTVYKRCHYVISETERMLRATDALQNDDFETFGQLMFETHRGLQYEYEVSCEELDFLVDEVKNNKSVLGARMMGGGFGGCTINLVKKEAVGALVESISRAYSLKFGKTPEHYQVSITDGCSVV